MTPLINDLRANLERVVRETAADQRLSAQQTEALVHALKRDGTIGKTADRVRDEITAQLRKSIGQYAAWLVSAGLNQAARVGRGERKAS